MSTPAEPDTVHTTTTASGSAATGEEGTPLQYATVEEWVRDYLLPSFPRAVGELGASDRLALRILQLG